MQNLDQTDESFILDAATLEDKGKDPVGTSIDIELRTPNEEAFSGDDIREPSCAVMDPDEKVEVPDESRHS